MALRMIAVGSDPHVEPPPPWTPVVDPAAPLDEPPGPDAPGPDAVAGDDTEPVPCAQPRSAKAIVMTANGAPTPPADHRREPRIASPFTGRSRYHWLGRGQHPAPCPPSHRVVSERFSWRAHLC